MGKWYTNTQMHRILFLRENLVLLDFKLEWWNVEIPVGINFLLWSCRMFISGCFGFEEEKGRFPILSLYMLDKGASSVTCVASSFWADVFWSTTFAAAIKVVGRWRFQPMLCVVFFVSDEIFLFVYLVFCFFTYFLLENVIRWLQNNHQRVC